MKQSNREIKLINSSYTMRLKNQQLLQLLLLQLNQAHHHQQLLQLMQMHTLKPNSTLLCHQICHPHLYQKYKKQKKLQKQLLQLQKYPIKTSLLLHQKPIQIKTLHQFLPPLLFQCMELLLLSTVQMSDLQMTILTLLNDSLAVKNTYLRILPAQNSLHHLADVSEMGILLTQWRQYFMLRLKDYGRVLRAI